MKAHIFNEQFSVKQEVVRLTSIRTHNYTCFNIPILAVLLANIPIACLHNSALSANSQHVATSVRVFAGNMAVCEINC